MEVEKYLRGSTLFRRLKNGRHGQQIEWFASHLKEVGLGRQGTWRSLNVVSGFLSWLGRRRCSLASVDECTTEQYLRYRARKQSIQLGDRAVLKRWLAVLRNGGIIAAAVPTPPTSHDRIFKAFDEYLQTERGLADKSIIRHLPIIRRFLEEVCPAGSADLCKINQKDVTRYVERHARDCSPETGKVMCWSLRAFLRYLHHQGLNPRSLTGCVPSIRRWKLASLPTYLPAAQVQKSLDGCDRTTAIGRRDYAVLMMLAKLGLRAAEVATLNLDDVDWRAGEMLVRAKGRQRARMPMPSDVGAAVVDYLRNGRPTSSSRRLFVRTLAPHVGFTSGCAITMIAKAALDRVGIHGCAHRGAHVFRHSLATELLRSGATLSEIGQLLRHKSHDTTRIYAKVDIEALKAVSPPWLGDAR